jgi:hypothetical protein
MADEMPPEATDETAVPVPAPEELQPGYAWICHPKLDNRRIQVPESAVQIHRGSGWLPAEEVEEPPKEEKKPAARRRRDSEKENS